jgi:LytS/YehU family sensor histidine kinase
LIGLFLVILLFALLLFRQNRLKTEQNALMLEQKLLRSQMNPHFLFNSLASIQNFIVTEDPDKASIYLSRFSSLMRNILDSSAEEFIPLEKEISTITYYLELQKVRYAGKFDFNIDVDENIDEENMNIPPMLAQPFIENAIEHGIKHKSSKGHISISFSFNEDVILISVEDDGVGRIRAAEIEKQHKKDHHSMATSITRDRLANLNRKLKTKISLEIIDLKNKQGEASGTKVIFSIPVHH